MGVDKATNVGATAGKGPRALTDAQMAKRVDTINSRLEKLKALTSAAREKVATVSAKLAALGWSPATAAQREPLTAELNAQLARVPQLGFEAQTLYLERHALEASGFRLAQVFQAPQDVAKVKELVRSQFHTTDSIGRLQLRPEVTFDAQKRALAKELGRPATPEQYKAVQYFILAISQRNEDLRSAAYGPGR